MERQKPDQKATPRRPLTGVGAWGRVDDEFAAPLQDDLAAASNLMANPAASFVAMSALGLSFATQAFGFWLGAVTGAAQASKSLLGPQAKAVREETPNEPARPIADVIPMPVRKPVHKPVHKGAVKAEAAPAKAASAALRAKAKAEPAAKPVAAVTMPASQALMPEDFRKPRAIARPSAPDDLKAIEGVGPKLEKVLNDLGIWTYAQVAAWQQEEVAWVEDFLAFKGRIERDGWIAQAARLAKG
jgi:NADH-quinone oxidoreductase subunit E